MKIFDHTQYTIKTFPDQRLLISESKKSQWLGTIEIIVAISIASGMMLERASYDLINFWPFQLMACTGLLVLKYLWTPGFIEFDGFSQLLIVQVRQHKIFRHRTINFQDIACLEVFHQSWENDGDTYESYTFDVVLKDTQHVTTLVIRTRAEAQVMWETIEQATGFKIKHRA